MDEKPKRPPLTEDKAIALAVAGLYGESLRALERGDTEQAEILKEAFGLLSAGLCLERGDYPMMHQLCYTMQKAHEERVRK